MTQNNFKSLWNTSIIYKPSDEKFKFSYQHLESGVKYFFKELKKQKITADYIGVLVTMNFANESDTPNKSIAPLHKVEISKDGEKSLSDYLKAQLDHKESGYNDEDIIGLTFGFKIGTGPLINNHLFKKGSVNFHRISYSKLPFGNPYNGLDHFGELTGDFFTKEGVPVKTFLSQNATYNVEIEEEKTEILLRVKRISLKGDNFTFIDHAIKGTDYFTRTFLKFIEKEKRWEENKKLMFNNNNELIWTLDNKNYKNIPKKKVNKKSTTSLVTSDIETFNSFNEEKGEWVINPYLLCMYNGEQYYNYYIKDYNSISSLIFQYLQDLEKITRSNFHKNHANRVTANYFHNFSGFDSNFLLRYLILNSGKVTSNNGRVISVDFTYTEYYEYKGEKKTATLTLKFVDSFQILPSSLAKLGKTFNKEEQKGVFDFSKVTEYNLDSIIKEAIAYCNQDCLVLYQIMYKFNQLIFSNFKLNIWVFPTISSIAMAIYRSNYLGSFSIPQIPGDAFRQLKVGYTGGSTDMYIPKFVESDKPLLYLDVNSLYPSIYGYTALPCGKVSYFAGDIYKLHDQYPDLIPKPNGFFYCYITAPENLEHPIIQIKHEKNTVSPTGKFPFLLYSKEIENARSLGYEIQVEGGYNFSDSQFLFKNYVDAIYKLRQSYSKENPMNLVAKLLLNSLYGRFGLDTNFSTRELMTSEEYDKFFKENGNKIVGTIELGGGLYYLEYKEDGKSDLQSGDDITSIAVSMAITAESRIFMSKFKNNPSLKLYYTDTDSIFVENSLKEIEDVVPGIIDNKQLGKLKLECAISKAVFLAPKSYYYETVEGERVCKLKGVKRQVIAKYLEEGVINFEMFVTLLNKDQNFVLNQAKWFKDKLTNIRIVEGSFNLKMNDNKRDLVFNDSGECINTIPKNIVKANTHDTICKTLTQN